MIFDLIYFLSILFSPHQSQETTTLQTKIIHIPRTTPEPRTIMTKEECTSAHKRKLLPAPNSIDDIAPLVQIFSNGRTPSVEIENDVRVSARMIEGYVRDDTSRVIFITHGFLGSIKDQWLHDMKDAILGVTRGQSQIVVLVGWKKGASILHECLYWQTAANTQMVGNFTGDIAAGVKERMQARGRRSRDLQIYGIGHSLGSHVMGAAGRRGRIHGYDPRNGEFLFTRITGLDPAGPSFEMHNFDKRLSKTDAAFVDAIHTDGSPEGNKILLDHYGTLIPLGHLDFYPNGGRRYQPGCEPSFVDVIDLKNIEGCSHQKAVDYYISSISNKGMFTSAKKIFKEPTWDTIDTKGRRMALRPEMGYYADTVPTRAGWWIVDTRVGIVIIQ